MSSETDALDAELDALFQLLPAELVPARNALADKLKKAGDKPSADKVKAIKRPTPGAWAINQVFHRRPQLLEQARARALELRDLHAADGVDGRRLTAAVDAQRGAVQAVVDAAMRFIDEAGLTGGAPQERKIFATIQGWLAGQADEPLGRMTHDLESGGFAAIGSVGLTFPPPVAAGKIDGASGGANADRAASQAKSPAREQTSGGIEVAARRAGQKHEAGARRTTAAAPVPLAKPKVAEPDPKVIAHATEQLAKREREARAALERSRDRAKDAKQAELELDRAKLQVKDAERALVHLRAAVAKREKEHAHAAAVASEADEDRQQAEEAVTAAKVELARVRKHGAK